MFLLPNIRKELVTYLRILHHIVGPVEIGCGCCITVGTVFFGNWSVKATLYILDWTQIFFNSLNLFWTKLICNCSKKLPSNTLIRTVLLYFWRLTCMAVSWKLSVLTFTSIFSLERYIPAALSHCANILQKAKEDK